MITPQDIQSKQFHVKFRGFDVDEVDVFLERVAEDMLTLIQENKQLREKNEEILRDMDSFKQQSRTFQDAIITAQKIADEMKAKGIEEAHQVVQRAQSEAHQLQEQATREITALERQVDELKAIRGQLREELLRLLEKTGNQVDEIFGRSAAPVPQRSRREILQTQEIQEPPAAVAAPVLAAIPSPAHEPEPEPKRELEPSTKPAKKSSSSELPAPDFSDLYTSINIADDFAGPPPLPTFAITGDSPAPAVDLDFGKDAATPHDEGPLPDIEGDMSFSLEDPLDMESGNTGSRKKKR